MGRPLFSHHQTPAVRVEPEQPHPACEKWTYWNAFDPDSDEFFERDDAVYEAFVAHDGIALPRSPTVIEAPSSSSSEASSSGRGSPTEDTGRDLSTEEIDLALRREADLIRLSATREDEIQRRVREAREVFADSGLPIPDIPADADPASVLRYVRGLDGISRHTSTQAVRERVLPPPSPSAPRETSLRLSDLSATAGDLVRAEPTTEQASSARGIPVAAPSTLSATASTQTHSVPDRPITPPHNIGLLTTQLLSTPPSRSPALDASPSPPPTVTPRLYSWSSRNPPPATPVSPGPLRNRDARLSVEHISALPDSSPSRMGVRARATVVRTVPLRNRNIFPDAPRAEISSWIVS
ncbi:hypothetical protein FOMPIDRAFT_1014972 [Fomitopsis schrenkii]|uniref:Uncharacterized protein n=1 Tax=Fomitopsis schrenkii TaxID=2126942 RepID=S8FXP2_FOMSC|nr:hypothetical protein FOMPIDRAFT_1014972 [Fomitopsis schrenkii]